MAEESPPAWETGKSNIFIVSLHDSAFGVEGSADYDPDATGVDVDKYHIFINCLTLLEKSVGDDPSMSDLADEISNLTYGHSLTSEQLSAFETSIRNA